VIWLEKGHLRIEQATGFEHSNRFRDRAGGIFHVFEDTWRITKSLDASENGSAIADPMTSVVPESKMSTLMTRGPRSVKPAPTFSTVACSPAALTSDATRCWVRDVTKNGSGGVAIVPRSFRIALVIAQHAID
jgi:hypothetical protein